MGWFFSLPFSLFLLLDARLLYTRLLTFYYSDFQSFYLIDTHMADGILEGE